VFSRGGILLGRGVSVTGLFFYFNLMEFQMKTTTEKKFIAAARKVHGDKYDYSMINYKNGKIKVVSICDKKNK
jgi:hypothetical protein